MVLLSAHFGSHVILIFVWCVRQTESAAKRISELLAKRREHEPVTAVRVGIKSRGCNGLSYTMNYATEKQKLEEEVVQHGKPSSTLSTSSAFCWVHEMLSVSSPRVYMRSSVRSIEPVGMPTCAGATVYVAPKALMHIIGTTMDYVECCACLAYVFCRMTWLPNLSFIIPMQMPRAGAESHSRCNNELQLQPAEAALHVHGRLGP
eukprot:3507743-Pleurochrysis_carterae.AAC.3